ncbi:Mesaconyl-C(4)-CoA hydratase [Paraburkholderia sediminicola]|uniref:Mesaconyl-C(4)-CoA hydratase n=1 Tax=Paraburkholderia sediminicola TaxID=458836 RepID=A0A6J5CSL5_9BURK|nr:MaoC family dehydratase N-terminal domain-containing protein [Paraburkholderia sediminicola]CAB3743793.1 Mesaconyl-C(4)-CoA hydratase [Paraburkholderia sediminicola]
MGDDAHPYAPWLNRTAVLEDTVTDFPLTALAATLDRDTPESHVPPGWHWLYFLPAGKQAELGADGHPARGGFLPPIALPRRMWAAGRLTFHRPLKKGDRVRRTSTILSINEKSGRSGKLVFVTVRHDITAGDELAISEEQDIVYRDVALPGVRPVDPTPSPVNEDYSRELTADPVMLFRYSALTFNGHRIHYDQPYATNEEGYPGLVVHGPLIATLLLDLHARQFPDATLQTFNFRAVRPTFADVRFALCVKRGETDGQIELWARDHEGFLTMQATAMHS